jgi:hypothetical protein
MTIAKHRFVTDFRVKNRKTSTSGTETLNYGRKTCKDLTHSLQN